MRIIMAVALLVSSTIEGLSEQTNFKNRSGLSTQSSVWYTARTVCATDKLSQLKALMKKLNKKEISEAVIREGKFGCLYLSLGPFSDDKSVMSFLDESIPKELLSEVFNEGGTKSATYPYRSEALEKDGELCNLIISDSLEIEAPKDLTDPGVIKNVQKSLQILGFYRHQIDGVLGPQSKKAIKQYQKSLNYPETCKLTGVQYSHLFDTVADQPKKQRSDPSKSGESHIKKINDLNVLLIRRQNDYQEYLNTPIEDLIQFYGIIRGDPARKAVSVIFDKKCYYFQPSISIFNNIKRLIKDTKCYKFKDTNFELVQDQTPVIEVTKGGSFPIPVRLIMQPRFRKDISSISASLLNPDFDDHHQCAFYLEFTNFKTQKSFSVMMRPEPETKPKESIPDNEVQVDLSKSVFFSATAEDIKKALTDEALTDKENVWAELSVQIKKYDDQTVSCKPASDEEYFIGKNNSTGAFTISQDGKLQIPEIELNAAKDDLFVFISTNIGEVSKASGPLEYNTNYPFSDPKKWCLQEWFINRSLAAIQKYSRKLAPKYKNIQIFQTKKHKISPNLNEDYFLVLTVPLPNSSMPMEALNLNYNNKLKKQSDECLTSGEHKHPPSQNVIPDVSTKLQSMQVPTSAGVLIIGSFGLEEENICRGMQLKKVIENRLPGSTAVISFVPYGHLKFKKEYPPAANTLSASTCPDETAITLIAPSKQDQKFSDQVSADLFTIINKGFTNE